MHTVMGLPARRAAKSGALTAAALLVAVAVPGLTGGVASAGGVPAVTRAQLRSATVTECGNAATTDLQNGSYQLPTTADGTPGGEGVLRWRSAALGQMTATKATDAVAVLSCDAGGTAWPQVAVLYGPGPTLLGWTQLIPDRDAQSHEGTMSPVVIRDRKAYVTFMAGYDYGTETYRGVLTWGKRPPADRGQLFGGNVTLRTGGPLTVDYSHATDDGGGTDYGTVDAAHPAKDSLITLPAAFQHFIQDDVLPHAMGQDVGEPHQVLVQRYSHLGFAYGAASAPVVWYRSKGKWTSLVSGGDAGYECSELKQDALLKRALTVLGATCTYTKKTADGGEFAFRRLGNWPRSGQ